MKKLLFKLALFSPLFLILIAIQWLSQNARFFNAPEYAIAQSWLNQNNIAFSFDYDDRIAHKYYITQSEKKDIIVLGSSRSTKIDKDFFKNKTFFNHSVTGADLEDYIGIYQLLVKKNTVPKEIIIGVDPWVLSEYKAKPKRWIDLRKEFYTFNKNNFTPQNISMAFYYYQEKYKTFFYLPHIQYTIERILLTMSARFLNHKTLYSPTTDSDSFLPVVHADGSIAESQKIRMKKPEDVTMEIKASKTLCPTELNRQLSKTKISIFNTFLNALKKQNIKITVWLAPFHPITYTEIQSNPSCNLAISVEDYVRDISKKYNASIIGSYNPNHYNLKDGDFYDSIHPKKETVKNIFIKDNLEN